MPSEQQPVIAIVGPTASGKSSLALRLAEALDGEIVSADSMQIYRGMDIGTAKVPVEERTVRHYGLDLIDPGEPYSAALFQAYARQAFDEIEGHGKQPVLCGGTGFYVRAALDDYEFAAGEQVGNVVRDRYNEMLQAQGPEAVWEALQELDPLSAAKIHPHDSKRVIRALEMQAAGESYAERAERLHRIGESVPAIFVGIAVEREALRQRIDDRVDLMREQGLVDEVRGLLDAGFRDGVTARHAIGYKEVAAALDGSITMDEAFESIKTATKRYAKRQRTWFGSDKRIGWIDGDSGDLDHMFAQTLDILGERA